MFKTEHALNWNQTAEEISAEYTKMAQWIEELETSWRQLKRFTLIEGGMNIEQADSHSRTMLYEAKNRFFGET